MDEILCSNHLYETTVCSPLFVETVDKNLWYDNSNETTFAVLSHRANSFSDYFHFAKLTLELFLEVKRLTVVDRVFLFLKFHVLSKHCLGRRALPHF